MLHLIELENWGVDVDALKEPDVSQTVVQWTKDWERKKWKWKTDGAVKKVLFSNKYKDLCFVLPNTGHRYYICEEDIVYRRCLVWVIYAQCDVPGVEEDEVTIFDFFLLVYY